MPNQLGFKALKPSLTLVLLVLFSQPALATTDLFDNLREDLRVPEHCRVTELSDFRSPQIEYFALSIVGGTERGFHREYPIDRKDAHTLWQVFVNDDHDEAWFQRELNSNSVLKRDYEVLIQHAAEMGFTFAIEGEVLEALAIVAMQEEFQGRGLFITGSVQYHDRLAGELDIVVARESDCRVQAVGEAKLGIHRISKARKQLRRFQEFLQEHLPFDIFAPFDMTSGL